MINKGTMDPKRSMVPFVDTCRCFCKKLVKNFKKVLTARLESVILTELSRRIVSSEQTI